MCVSEGKASMPITCCTSSNCNPSAWLKCLRACLREKKIGCFYKYWLIDKYLNDNTTANGSHIKNWNHKWSLLSELNECCFALCIQCLSVLNNNVKVSYRTASMRLFCRMSSINSWILKLNSKQLWEQDSIWTKWLPNPKTPP